MRTASLFTPRSGLEPETYRLTAGCSTIELSRIAKQRQRIRLYPGWRGDARESKLKKQKKNPLAMTYSCMQSPTHYHRR